MRSAVGLMLPTVLSSCGTSQVANTAERDPSRLVVNLGAKDAWHRAVSSRGVTKANGVILGGSTAEGAKAVPWTDRFSCALEKGLQRNFNVSGVPGGYVIRARDSAWNPAGNTENADLDLGLRSRTVNVGGSLTHFTVQPATGIQIGYYQTLYPSSFTVEMGDQTFKISSGPISPSQPKQELWESPTVSRKKQRIRITTDAPVTFCNTAIRDGDSYRGFSLYQAAHAGWTSEDFLSTKASSMWERMERLNPVLAVVCLGTNDRANGVRPQQYKSGLVALIDRISSCSAIDPWIILVAQQNLSNRGPAPWIDYMECMKSLASSYRNVTYTSIYEFFPQIAGASNDPHGYIASDDTHLTGAGHRLAGELISRELGLGVGSYWP